MSDLYPLTGRFPKHWERFIMAAKRKRTGEEFDWCMEQATRITPLCRLTEQQEREFDALDHEGNRE